MKTLESFYSLIETASTEEEIGKLRETALKQGYAFVNEWALDLKKKLEEADGFTELDRIENKVDHAIRVLPEPHRLSPLWEGLWSEMLQVISTKRSLYDKISETEQSGEWQLLFNNPFSTEGVVIHANLSFSKATYQFAEYRKDLAKHEYISLQKSNSLHHGVR